MSMHGMIDGRQMDRAEYMDTYGIHEAELHDDEPETFFTCPVCHRLEWETEREAAECCVRHTPGFASMLANRCKEITGCPNGRAE